MAEITLDMNGANSRRGASRDVAVLVRFNSGEAAAVHKAAAEALMEVTTFCRCALLGAVGGALAVPAPVDPRQLPLPVGTTEAPAVDAPAKKKPSKRAARKAPAPAKKPTPKRGSKGRKP